MPFLTFLRRQMRQSNLNKVTSPSTPKSSRIFPVAVKNVEKVLESPSEMVQGIDIIKVDVAFLSYNPRVPIDKPKVSLDNVCTAGAYEIKKHREAKKLQKYDMGYAPYKHYKWYNSVLRTELHNHENPNAKLRIYHWNIESSNKMAFVMDDSFFRAVSIIISPMTEYWYCTNTSSDSVPVYGSRARPLQSTPIPSPMESKVMLCSKGFCANNCEECQKSPPKVKNTKPKCACYIAKKLERINEENECDGECTISPDSPGYLALAKALATLEEKRNVLRCDGDKERLQRMKRKQQPKSYV